MGDIKCLPEDIRNSVRSAIILFDLTRIVEELIFNSLDAGATKISVAVGAEACYVKVVDNGCGITRDGLVLLAERYASSKFDELADSHAVARSFGFRGEALSSIANVSLLEVLTKAHGRPNGYRKIMKGCKCLYIGIDDGRKDVGTTVIVRDLFYNQPVRRKLMHSSPKKELESVKKCVLRISLVHQTVSFKVVDIESDDELFCASPSSSPLSRLTSGFGVEVANSLHELNATNGELKLSGYMSNPRDISSAKAFQYIYINSRYISKGTIHKLLNQLTSTINFLQHQKVNEVSPIAKRSKIQICFSFILNLCCPRSWYDLSFEPSKTSVDFKDWKPIIDFIEKSITCFWSKFVSHGEALNDGTGVHVPTDKVEIEAAHTSSPGKDFPAKCRTNKRKNRLQNHTSPIAFPSPYLEKQSKNYDYLDCLKEHKIFGHDITYRKDSSFNYFDESPAMSWAAVDQEIGSCDYGADYNVFSTEYQLVVSKSFVPEKYKKQTEYISEFGFDEEHFKMEATLTNGYLKANIPSDSFGIDNMKITSKTFEKPFLKSCRSSKRRVLYEESHFRSEGLDESLPNKYFNNDIASDPFEISNLANMHNFVEKPFIRSCRTQKRQILDEESLIRSEEFDFPIENFRCKRTCNMPSELNFPSENPIKSYLIGGDLHTENGLLEEIVPVFGSKSRFEYDFDENPWRGYESSTKCNYLAERGNLDLNFYSDDIVSRSISSREYCNLFKGDGTYSGYKKYAPTEKDSYGFQPQHKKYVAFPTSSDMFINEKKLLSSDLYCEDDGYCCPITSHLKVNNDKDHKYIKESLSKPRPRRSHSAPPFFRGKKVFVSSYFLAVEKKGKKLSVDGPEADELKHPKKSIAVSPLDSESNSRKDLLVYTREIIKGPNTCGIERVKEKEPLEDLQLNCTDLIEENQDLVVPDLKWQQGYTKTKNEIKSYNSQNEDKILDVSSALLRLAGDSLIPESINKNFLKDAKVLQQVDKKFIPVVANGVLAIIDQHAADERIRLEELRQKVLLGEKKTITYLDTEQKLVMPEMGYQLLHTYAEQIEKWGWLCDIHSQDSRSFKKSLNILHKKRKGFTLIAVPCILGVNLTDVDLLEFLQQLADTDGSSTIPPSVNRILNSKACRGAIMFGDTLLPSECSLIVEELKQTSLCFQCAHGRPTTVPVINLEALHKQIAKLKSWNKNSDMWHGLRRNIPSLEWATNRLSPAEV